MSYTPRTTAPTTDNAYYYSNNPFYTSGYGLPNCTCYAWGRFYEVLGSRPKLSLGDAEDWWSFADGYERGATPRLGAVICWSRGIVGVDSDGAGHVAVVEVINPDGTILTSESGWGASKIFWTKTRSNDGNWGQSSANGYKFQGFIYNPAISENQSGQLEWIAKNAYLTNAQMENNAKIVYNYMVAKGWTKNAIAALLGNMEVESTINPGIWESLTKDPEAYYTAHGRYPGFGIVQWTPYTKYTEWAGSASTLGNWNKQLDRLIYEMENGLQYYPTPNYPETFREFSVSTKSAYYLAGAFLYNYERPASPNATDRGNRAEKWYSFICNLPTVGPSGPIKIPYWLLFKLSERRG